MAHQALESPTPATRQVRQDSDLFERCLLSRTVCYTHLRMAQRFARQYASQSGDVSCASNIASLLDRIALGYRPDQVSTQTPCSTDDEITGWVAQYRQMDDLLIDLASRCFPKPGCDKTATTLPARAGLNKERLEELREIKNLLLTLSFLEILSGQTRLCAPPRWVVVDQTSACNSRCKMCYCHGSSRRVFPSRFSAGENLVDTLPYADRISFAGTGEPLMHPDFSILDNCDLESTAVNISTNGLLLDSCLEQLEPIQAIAISFDSADRDIFELLRAGSRFELVVENIRRARERFPRKALGFNVTVSRLNLPELRAVAALGAALRMNFVMFTPIVADGEIAFLQLQESDSTLYRDQIRQIRSEFGGITAIIDNTDLRCFDSGPSGFGMTGSDLKSRLRRIRPAPVRAVRSLRQVEEELAGFLDFHWNPQERRREYRQTPDRRASIPAQYAVRSVRILIEIDTEKLADTGFAHMPFCLLPWLSIFVGADSMVRACCFKELSESIAEKTSWGAWNGPAYQKLRQAHLDRGSLPETCRTCTSSLRDWRRDELLLFAARYGWNLCR